MYQVSAFNTQNPDPGTAQYGWDEGTALRRLETLNCLYWLHAPRASATAIARAP
jgi:hypothetical protein